MKKQEKGSKMYNLSLEKLEVKWRNEAVKLEGI